MTETRTATLAEFLLARIAEDEERGRSLVAQWSDVGNACQSCGTNGARVLTECEAKRRIVAEHAPTRPDPDDKRLIPGYCRMCVGESGWPVKKGQIGVGVVAPCLTVRLLALPYVGHADYREEWRV